MKSRVFSAALALCLCVSAAPKTYAYQEPPSLWEQGWHSAAALDSRDAAANLTEKEAYDRMIALKADYPEGRKWTNSTPYTLSNPYNWQGSGIGVSGGVGCAAFAFILSDAAFGSMPAAMRATGQFSLSDVHVGDILRGVNNATHTVIVLQVSESGVVVAEGNYNKTVHWGRTLTKDEVETAEALVTRYPGGIPMPDGSSPDDPLDANAEGTLAGGLVWKLAKSGTLTISGTGAMPDYAAGDQPWNAYLDRILSIVIDDGVARVGNNAFYGSKAMSVTIPDGVKEIGDNAFRSCTELHAVALPASIENVGSGAFMSTGLTYAVFAPSGGNVSLGSAAFMQCQKLVSVSLPQNIDRIRGQTFGGCLSLRSLYIPKSVTSFGEEGQEAQAFDIFINCNSLSDIYFGGSEAQWNALLTPYIRPTLTGKTIHYNEPLPSPFDPDNSFIEDGTDPTPDHTHTWDSGEVSKEPTCTEDGARTYTCTVSGCGHTKTESIPALGHDHSQVDVIKEATCTEDGQQTLSCFRCGDTLVEIVRATGHSFVLNADGSYECSNERDANGDSATVVTAAMAEGYNAITMEDPLTASYSCQDAESARQYASDIIQDALASIGNPLSYTINTISYTPPTQTVNGEYVYTATLRLDERAVATALTTEPLHLIIPTPPQPTKYSVTVNGSYASTTGAGSYEADATVAIYAGSRSHYLFDRWTSSDDVSFSNAESPSTTFIMPDQAVTVKANWIYDSSFSDSSSDGGYTPAATYPPTVERPREGGSVAVSPTNPERGDIVTIKLTPDQGYEVDKITVTYQNGKPVEVKENSNGTFFFIQPNGRVKIEVAYKAVETPWTNSFADVSENDWYYEAVRFANKCGLMNGYSDGRFAPNDNLSRAQLAQILFSNEGKPIVNYLMNFSDVAGGAWYAEAIRWSSSRGIVSGYGNGLFGPNDPITREQLAVILWRYSGSPAAASTQLRFIDKDEISGFALEAMSWAVENGVLSGYSGGRVEPNGQATRAQAAQVLKNYLER